jgi:Sir2- and TIR-associating SLOG family/SIR2-like domain
MMTGIKKEHGVFIKDFVKDLAENNVAIFAGAGLSRASGYVNWGELLFDIADELGLSIDREYDLVSLAQYHVNEKSRAKLSKKIIEEFTEENELTDNHRILARLPISTYWTTNYDTLIENSLKEANKVIDVKHQVEHIFNTRPKRDVVIYKMHGDVSLPTKAILTKEDYEGYHTTHEPFISALTGDLITKTFLFIGFSFTDPNLDYVLSRINVKHSKEKRHHYCFIKKPKLGEKGNEEKADFDYNLRKQLLMIGELKRYGIQALPVDRYDEITEILREIENRFRKRTIFISGSVEEYGQWERAEAQEFIHRLSKKIVSSGFRIVNGFGWGIGSAVINGALEAIYERPNKFSEEQLIIKPFPQFKTGEKELPELWKEYRERMIRYAGIAIFIFGNKFDKDKNVVLADGVRKEFEIAIAQGLIPLPISPTGFMAREIYEELSHNFKSYYGENEEIISTIEEISKINPKEFEKIIDKIIQIIKGVNK